MNYEPFQEPLPEMLHFKLGKPCWVLVHTGTLDTIHQKKFHPPN